jgi:hypothetical protein
MIQEDTGASDREASLRLVVAAQIGRDPRGDIEVAVRCEFGLPMVIRTAPRLETGEPFPTMYWLACPMASRAIGGLESSGTMRDYEARLADDLDLAASYREAHARYRRDRDGGLDGRDESAGGMPSRVKCLHALYAHELADANPIGALARAEVEPLGCPGPCVEERGGDVARVAGHPGFGGKRRG